MPVLNLNGVTVVVGLQVPVPLELAACTGIVKPEPLAVAWA